MLTVLLLATSCASPGRKELAERLEKSRAETRILRKLVPSKDGLDLKEAGAFIITARDTKWGKGEFRIYHAARTRMGLISCYAYASLYSYDLLNVQIEKNRLVADGKRTSAKWALGDSEAPTPPKNIKVTVFVEKYAGTEKCDGHFKAVFDGNLVIEEKP